MLQCWPSASAREALQQIEDHLTVSVSDSHPDKLPVQGIMFPQVTLSILGVLHLETQYFLPHKIL